MERPGAWAHKVPVNLARSRFRRRGSRRRAEQRLRAGAIEAASAVPADAIALRDAVAALPDDERAVIALRYFADLSVAETASALGPPDGTVKTRTRRAAERLADAGLRVDEPDDAIEVTR